MKLISCALFLGLLTSAVGAQTRPAIEHYNLGKSSLAIEGYDPVAYFPQGGGKATKGREGLTLTHQGVTYRFASEANRRAFEAAPARFEPGYGGWCAYAMAKTGEKVEVDPDSFLIQDNRLLLFYDGFFNDTRKKWGKEGGAELAPRADRNWKRLSGEGAARDTRHFNLADGLALEGSDPVAYFDAGTSRAKPGRADLTVWHQDVGYRFASEENRKRFLTSPSSFEPGYGGYCAWAMARGKKVDVDPDAFLISDGALLLFYNEAKRDEWKADAAKLAAEADRHWGRLHETPR